MFVTRAAAWTWQPWRGPAPPREQLASLGLCRQPGALSMPSTWGAASAPCSFLMRNGNFMFYL